MNAGQQIATNMAYGTRARPLVFEQHGKPQSLITMATMPWVCEIREQQDVASCSEESLANWYHTWMQRVEQHEIDDAAQQVMKQILYKDWVIREQKPDYGIDFIAELSASENSTANRSKIMTGITFAIQLKGTLRVRLLRGLISFSLLTKHLIYYVDRSKYPVFLILVDVANNEAYWIFLQDYATTNLTNNSWRTQRSVVIHIPIKNLLRNREALLMQVKQANSLMTARQPCAIQDALSAEKQRVQNLDSRFEVDICATEGVQRYEVRARERVDVLMLFKGDQAAVQKWHTDLFGRGLPVTLTPENVEIHGSPLLAEIFRRPLTVQMQNKARVELDVCCGNSNGSNSSIPIPNATLSGGASEIRLEAGLPFAPFRFDMTITKSNDCPIKIEQSKFSFHLSEWGGQPLLQLAYFDQMLSFFYEIEQCEKLTMKCSALGNILFRCTASTNSCDALIQMAKVVRQLGKARDVARRISAQPLFPKELKASHLEEIDFLHWVFCENGAAKPANNRSVTATLGWRGISNILKAQKKQNGAGVLRLERRDMPMTFLDQEVPVPRHAFAITHAELTTKRSRLRIAQLEKKDILITWQGTPNSLLSAEIIDA